MNAVTLARTARPIAVRSPTPSDHLRILARAVERLGVSGRTTPEEITVTKLSVAREMRALAKELER